MLPGDQAESVSNLPRAPEGHIEPGPDGERDRVRDRFLAAGRVPALGSPDSTEDGEAPIPTCLDARDPAAAAVEGDSCPTEAGDESTTEADALTVTTLARPGERDTESGHPHIRLRALARLRGRGYPCREQAGPVDVLDGRTVGCPAVAEIPVVDDAVACRSQRHLKGSDSPRRACLCAHGRRRRVGGRGEHERRHENRCTPHASRITPYVVAASARTAPLKQA
jgi:hypothetical protein